MVKPLDIAGETFGRLTALTRIESDKRGRAQWICTCSCGKTRVVRAVDLRSGNSKSCGCLHRELASDANRKPDDRITYGSAHDRVERARGRASTYICIDCCAQAAHWSLRHDAPVVHLGKTPNGYTCGYSGSPDDYEPRCAPCHVKYDSMGAPV
jgi:hypothetical protein